MLATLELQDHHHGEQLLPGRRSMVEFGVAMVMQNAHDQLSDREAYERDLHISQLIEPLGFDRISSVEHHFDNYSMSPDNISLLSWLSRQHHTPPAAYI